jgi:hypothetical protein
MASRSPYPQGHVARVQDPHEGKLSAVLVPRPMGYLVVRIYFHRVPVEGLEVKFFESSGGSKGAQVGEAVRTLADGIARVDMLVPAVEYICEIERQPPAAVTTVCSLEQSFPLVLPIGRPFVDVDEDHEFDPDFP